MATCPIKEFFDFPELTEQVVQYLTFHEVLQCMKTCKALYNLKQYFFHHVELKKRHPAPDDLARYRYHIRILNVPCDEPVNLEVVAKGLPRRTLSKAGSSTEEPEPSSQGPGSFVNSAASRITMSGSPYLPLSPLDKHVFQHLQSISLQSNSKNMEDLIQRTILLHHADELHETQQIPPENMDVRESLKICTNSFLQILDYSPYVHDLTLPAEMLTQLDSSLVEQFLDTLANGTPILNYISS
ncbi:MAG: hypothetical protein J3Q66DRAFT_397461 [Benniella sp.]|nr:MAG: hypothetical protein J3Q66DRAFT_397461 [Benniella sp.]